MFQTARDKKTRRRSRKPAGTLMVDDSDIRKPAQKRDGVIIIGDEASQEVARHIEGRRPGSMVVTLLANNFGKQYVGHCQNVG